MKESRNDSIGNFIKSNFLALSLQIVSLVILFANLWLANKLAPMAQDIDRVVSRVEAVEDYNTENRPLIERFIKLETNYTGLTTVVERIEKKLDSVIERTVAIH